MASTDPLKVSINLTVELTQEAMESWCLNYAIDEKRSAIRDDVKRYVFYTVQGQLDEIIGEGITVTKGK